MPLPKTIWRLPIVAGGILILLGGMWGGLLRMGWPWPGIGAGAVSEHGALMVGGFLGTLISLERAVALGRRWTYAAPVAAAAGGVCLLIGLPPMAGQILMLLGSVVLVAIFIWLLVRQSTLFMWTMGLGALAWMAGNALWLGGWAIPFIVPWWIAFLVLTIVGERLELSRFLAPLRGRHLFFAIAVGLYALGVLLSLRWIGLGWFIAGLGLLAMSGWGLIHDLARRTIRQNNLPRFAAACLLSGYFWLAVGGLLAILDVLILPLLHGTAQSWLTTAPLAGLAYDSILHAILLGFVFAMIFGHAPIIFPAVLSVRMKYHPRFYLHLLLLEIAVALRIAADLAGWWTMRQWGGLLAALAILLFLIQTVTSLSLASPPPAPKQRPATGKTISLGVLAPPAAQKP
jgi:hypothetical protein